MMCLVATSSWITRERNDVANVCEACREHNEPLKAEPKACVGYGTVLPQVAIPAVGFRFLPHIPYPFLEDVQPLFALASSDLYSFQKH